MRGFMAKEIKEKEVEVIPELTNRQKILIARKKQLQRKNRLKIPNSLK